MRARADIAPRALRAAGATGAAVGCAAMVAMLPTALASALGAIGITGSSAFARALSPIAQPLFIASAVLLLLGALTCSKLVTVSTGAALTLLYLSMWVFPSSGGAPAGSMASMDAMSSSQSGARAEPTSFWTGAILVVASLAITAWRRRRGSCRPLIRLPLQSTHS